MALASVLRLLLSNGTPVAPPAGGGRILTEVYAPASPRQTELAGGVGYIGAPVVTGADLSVRLAHEATSALPSLHGLGALQLQAVLTAAARLPVQIAPTLITGLRRPMAVIAQMPSLIAHGSLRIYRLLSDLTSVAEDAIVARVNALAEALLETRLAEAGWAFDAAMILLADRITEGRRAYEQDRRNDQAAQLLGLVEADALKRPKDYLADWDAEDTAELPDDANHDQKREALIGPLGLTLVRRLTTLADHAASTDHGHASLADQMLPTLTRVYHQAFTRGARSFTPGYTPDHADVMRVARLVSQQHPYLTGLARDIGQGSLSGPQTASRLAQYGNGPVRLAFNLGRHEAMKDAGTERYTWLGEDDDGTCDLCAERIGETYTDETLPGEPGSGNFGDLCEGVCRCWLEPVEGAE